jgi:flagellar protein FliL
MGIAKLALPLVALAVGLAAGAAGGFLLAPAKEPEDAEAAEMEAPELPAVPDPSVPADFAQLNNQFVVPVLRAGAVRALVVLSITIEVTQGRSEAVFAMEPRLRDAFLQVLFEHANTGGFDDNFTQTERMSALRQGLREVAHRLLGPIVRDVLIVDIVRQEA